MFSPLEQFEVINIKFWTILNMDISYNSQIIPIGLLNLMLILLSLISYKNIKLIPNLWQHLIEKIYVFIYSIIKQQIGLKGINYLPLIFTLFVFVLFCNLLSMVPFGIAITSHIVLILYLSITLCVSIFIIGIIIHNFNFFKIFIPQSPFILLTILIPIEIFSYLIRMFSLSIRLAANILAGHTLVFIISSFILKVSIIRIIFYFILLLPILSILVLELGVAFLQAYVFIILISIYLNDSLKNPSH